MGLKDLTIPTEVVQFPGGEFAVRGLSLPDISFILSQHPVEVARIVEIVDAKRANSDASNDLIANAAFGLVQSSPDLAATVIAVSAGEPDQVSKVRQLPFPVQLEAMEKLGNLTFAVQGGPKKVLEAVIRLAKGAADLLGSLST